LGTRFLAALEMTMKEPLDMTLSGLLEMTMRGSHEMTGGRALKKRLENPLS
jgi:hypothetical protein